MKTDKTILLTLIIITISVITNSCYKDRENRHYTIPFTNNTEKKLIVTRSYHPTWLPSLGYPDTLLFSWDPSIGCPGFIVEPYEENNKSALFNTSFYESCFRADLDTLRIFVFDADTLEALGWETVREKYIVLQRYDLSLEDLQYLDFKLCFPPSEAMRDIHMWPPYGTYDEKGQIVGKK